MITETNAERAIDELKAYEAESATVLREGRLSLVPAADLVPGDIVEVSGASTILALSFVAHELHITAYAPAVCGAARSSANMGDFVRLRSSLARTNPPYAL